MKMTLRSVVIKTHRWLGVGAAAFWLLQAATGIFAVFHWEIDDAITAGKHQTTDWKAIERRVAGLSPNSIWTSAGAADRYDVNLSDRVMRIDGAGNILRVRLDGEKFSDGGFVDTLVVLHQSLLSGDRGRWFVGTSGLLLLSNLILGIIAAWPRPGQWRRALKPSTSGSRIAALYSWHRAAGLWLAIPSMLLVTAGILMAFENVTERVLQIESVDPAPQPSTAPLRIGMAQATTSAMAQYPGAAVSGIGFPSAENAIWKITLKQMGEWRRAYGKTRVFVSAVDGRIVAESNALRTPANLRFFNYLFSFHTGEMGGKPGRIAVLLVGLWLISMILLGIALWWTRRRAALRVRLG